MDLMRLYIFMLWIIWCIHTPIKSFDGFFVPLSMHACQQHTCFCCWSCVFACCISWTTWWIHHCLRTGLSQNVVHLLATCISGDGLTEDIRGRIVTLSEFGISVSRISVQLNIRVRTVQRVWRNFKLNGIRTTMHRSGRSMVTTPGKTGCWSGTPGWRASTLLLTYLTTWTDSPKDRYPEVLLFVAYVQPVYTEV